VPTRGIGKVTILKIFSGQKENLPAGIKIKVNQFFNLLKEINKINESNLAKLSDSERYSSILN
jgi:hypothetical protein